VSLRKLLHTTTFRLAAVFVAGFAASVAGLGVITYVITASALERRLDARMAIEMKALQADDRGGGLPRLIATVQAHQALHPNGAFEYAVVERGKRLAGNLTEWPSVPGWQDRPYNEIDGDVGRRRFLVADLNDGIRLVVAADPEQVDEVKQAVFYGFLSAFGAVVALGILGGAALSAALLKRVETIRSTAEAIIAGDLTRRVPVGGKGDDLDRLSQTINRMLDRMAELMESLREVSVNIAHDLKTPLARLRQRLEAAQAQSPDDRKAALEASTAHVDEILATFSALLRIAQIEAGTRRAGFAVVDLSDVFATVAEAFAPAAEDAGQILTASITPDLRITGDRELLTQMLANVVENAIRYTPAGTRIELTLRQDNRTILGAITDNGPGVPAEERERIFHRFHRLESGRGVPGSGLGLSLVKAVADIHAVAITAGDALPGLRLAMRFEPERQRGTGFGALGEELANAGRNS
jgi:signal transduction histidine kinase